MSDNFDEQALYDEKLARAELRRRARLGETIEREIQGSAALQWVLACAEREQADVKEILAAAEFDPHDWKHIQSLQNRLYVANAIGNFIKQAILSGRDAADHLAEEGDDTAEGAQGTDSSESDAGSTG